MWIGGALSRIHSVAARYQTSDLGSAATGIPASATARHRLEKTPRMTAKNTIRPYSSLRSQRASAAEIRENAAYLSKTRHHGGRGGHRDRIPPVLRVLCGGEFGAIDAAVMTTHSRSPLSWRSRTGR